MNLATGGDAPGYSYVAAFAAVKTSTFLSHLFEHPTMLGEHKKREASTFPFFVSFWYLYLGKNLVS